MHLVSFKAIFAEDHSVFSLGLKHVSNKIAQQNVPLTQMERHLFYEKKNKLYKSIFINYISHCTQKTSQIPKSNKRKVYYICIDKGRMLQVFKKNAATVHEERTYERLSATARRNRLKSTARYCNVINNYGTGFCTRNYHLQRLLFRCCFYNNFCYQMFFLSF